MFITYHNSNQMSDIFLIDSILSKQCLDNEEKQNNNEREVVYKKC